MQNNLNTVTIGICFLGLLLSVSYCNKVEADSSLAHKQAALNKGLTTMDIRCAELYGENTTPQMVVCTEYYRMKGRE